MRNVVKTGEIFATFNYDGKDSADMGIVNVTSSSTYIYNIEPTFSDNKLNVPAYDGTYYYGTQITGQQFQMNCFAYNLVIAEFNKLKAWLNPRHIGRLILPDQPYKYYLVKPISVSALSEIPLTTIQTPDNSVLGNFGKEDPVYVGNFTITFETVGSAYGYGLGYYREDLVYDAKDYYRPGIYEQNYYYDSGLLYRDMSPRLHWATEENDIKMPIPIYNPGSAESAPTIVLHLKSKTKENTFIQIDNNTIGSSTIIDVGGMEGDVIIDTSSQTITNKDKAYYGRFRGTAMRITGSNDVIAIPETFVQNVDLTDFVEYDSLYIQNNRVTLNPLIVKVTPDLVGRYFCCNNNGGSRIVGVDVTENMIFLEDKITTYDIPPATSTRPAGFEFRYVDVHNDESYKPAKPKLGDVIYIDYTTWPQEKMTKESDLPSVGANHTVYNDISTGNKYIWQDNQYIMLHSDFIWKTYMYNEWQLTNLFSSVEEFMDVTKEAYVPVYRMFGATIVELDDITITTGTNINYEKNGEILIGSTMPGFELEAGLQPRYL